MKLRNKKTGDIGHLLTTKGLESYDIITDNYELIKRYYSLAELNEEWEDCEPVESLIKDKKIRKAVRAWAEANDLDGATFYTSSHFWYLRTFNEREQGIDFWLKYEDKPNLIESKHYTIEELCGEEEE